MARQYWACYIISLLLFLATIILTVGCSAKTTSVSEPGLRCPEVTIENRSGDPINAKDRANANSAATRCVKYYPYSPCLITFTKTDVQTYRAICGVAR